MSEPEIVIHGVTEIRRFVTTCPADATGPEFQVTGLTIVCGDRAAMVLRLFADDGKPLDVIAGPRYVSLSVA